MFNLDVISAGLPVGTAVDELVRVLKAPGARVVVTAPPGSGKTTVVPAAAAVARGGRVLVTQPRRIAARAAAARLAELSCSPVGGLAGHTVRGESRVSPGTAVEFCTAGILVNRLLGDPDLTGTSTVVLDEVHERGLDTDLGFAMVQEVASLREDLGLVVMSATLDAARWMELLGPDAVLVEVGGVLHELTVEWAPLPAGVLPTHRGHLSQEFADHLTGIVASVATRTTGSVLVFVPTRRDVEEMVSRIRVPGMVTVGLSGGVKPQEQDDVLRGGDRRVVVATSVAESSLTVPGVRAVVDSGLSREPRFDSGRGMSGLVTVRESRASAEQRAGRAARLGPGLAVRCLPASEWAGMAADATPQVRVVDLSDAVLRLAAWGSTRGDGMALPDPLPTAGLERAIRALQGLGALDADERITDLGRRLVRVPTEPRLARGLLVGAEIVGTRAAAEVVAMLSGDLRCADGDLRRLLTDLRAGRMSGAQSWRVEARRLAGLVPGHGDGRPDPVGIVTALSKPEWIARRRDDGSGFLTASGTGVQVEPGSVLGRAPWLAIAELSRVEAGERNTSGAVVRAGVEIDEETALEAGARLLSTSTEARWHPESGRVRGRLVRRLGAIVLGSTPTRIDTEKCRTLLLKELHIHGLGLSKPGFLVWDDAARRLRDRLGFTHQVLGDDWPDVSEEALTSLAEVWLGPHLGQGSTKQIDVAGALRGLLGWQQLADLDRVVPERIVVPSGSRIRVRYPQVGSGGAPVLAVKLQECFGMISTPTICGVTVVMELLSPAQRPLAVTDDLESFWREVYPHVRAENRGRYAKHPWPQDPLTAEARRGTKKSGI